MPSTSRANVPLHRRLQPEPEPLRESPAPAEPSHARAPEGARAPRSAPERAPSALGPIDLTAADRPLKALIVDDEEDVRNIGEVSLRHFAHWHVLLASSGEEGAAIAARERPDVVLLDLTMPHTDGVETLAMLKRQASTARIPVILMTARPLDGEQVRATLAAGAAGILRKPFDPLTLGASIRQVLAMAAKPRPGRVHA